MKRTWEGSRAAACQKSGLYITSSCAGKQGMNAAIAVGGQIGDEHPDVRDQLGVGQRRSPAGPRRLSVVHGGQMLAADAEGVDDRGHWPSPGNYVERNNSFLSLRHGTRPRAGSRLPWSSCRAGATARSPVPATPKYSDAGTTSSPALATVSAPCAISPRQVNSCPAPMPRWRATSDTLMSGRHVSSAIRTFYSGVQRLRR